MENNLFFDIPFWIFNDKLKGIIKTSRTIYPSRAVLFTSVPLEGMANFFLSTVSIMSLKYKKLKNCP